MANYNAGDVIRLMRNAAGMSQEELSDGICSVETLSRIENGKHKIKQSTYAALMEKMERDTRKNYALCAEKIWNYWRNAFCWKMLLQNMTMKRLTGICIN